MGPCSHAGLPIAANHTDLGPALLTLPVPPSVFQQAVSTRERPALQAVAVAAQLRPDLLLLLVPGVWLPLGAVYQLAILNPNFAAFACAAD